MISRGIVKSYSEQTKLAIVSTFKEPECSSCSVCSEGSKFSGEIDIFSDKTLKEGELIEFEIDNKPIFFIGFIVYLLPVILFFAGYFISEIFTNKEAIKIVSAFTCVLLNTAVMVFVDKTKGKNINYDIKILSNGGALLV